MPTFQNENDFKVGSNSNINNNLPTLSSNPSNNTVNTIGTGLLNLFSDSVIDNFNKNL